MMAIMNSSALPTQHHQQLTVTVTSVARALNLLDNPLRQHSYKGVPGLSTVIRQVPAASMLAVQYFAGILMEALQFLTPLRSMQGTWDPPCTGGGTTLQDTPTF